MAALTDGTQAGTIPASPVVPTSTPTTAPTTTTPDLSAALTGKDQTAQIPEQKPTSVISSAPAADLVTQKIAPTLTQASADITAQNQKTASFTPGYTPVYDAQNNITGYNKVDATGKTTFQPSGTQTPTPEQTIANTPDAGYKFAYDTQGNRTQIPLTDTAATHGLTETNPKAAPTQNVTATTEDTLGNTFKRFDDGSYGIYDVAGNYKGTATADDYNNAQHSSGLLASLGQLANGTYPLTADQQAQVTGLQNTYGQLIKDQATANANFTGGTTVAMNLYGMGNTLTGIGEIKGTVDSGIAKIADLNNKMVSAVAQMKAGFQKDNLDLIKTAYTAYTDSSKERQAALDKITADAIAHQKDVQDRLDKQRTYDFDVEKFKQTKDQNAFDNAFKAEQQAFDEKYKKQQLALDQYKAGMGAGGSGVPGAPTTSASLTASGNPDPVSQKAVLDQITKSYGPMTAIAIKGLADYSINPMDWSSRAAKGMTREQAVSLAKMVDPTYSDAMYATRAAYMKSLASGTGGSIGSAINAANKSINHLTAYLNSVAKMDNGASQTINSLLNPLLNLDQNRRLIASAADTEGMGVADELAKFFKGTGTTDVSSIEAWRNKMDSNTTVGQQKGLAQGAITLLAGQLETLSEQYKAQMGKAPENNLLGPSAMANLSKLKDQGYQVDIPGVLFTDPKAYIASDSGASAKMDTARQALIKANDPNNPPTPENILQLAQLSQ